MCATCGCGSGETRIVPLNIGTDMDFKPMSCGHAAHAPGLARSRIVQIEQDILSKNDALAARNRAAFAAAGHFVLNIVSSPGSGKTTLLERTIRDLSATFPIAVIEGDQETSNDAERIKAAGAQSIQINTGRGCHLDADMVAKAYDELRPSPASLLFIENVGNLVCPSSFDLGEQARIVLFSITEGEDKPLKYPDIFASADIVLVSKLDLQPYLQCDLELIEENIRRVNRKARIMHVSARSGEGLEQWYGWLGNSARQRVA
ncbi:MAG: hydrogenase nickel incorporation protein HypB [Rhizobiales bacterium]|nr:hydrogenase nickel incorporation protein HypB [Hyphomicrobiales bacterium]